MGIGAMYRILNIQFVLFGYTLTMWSIFLFGIIATILIAFIKKLFD